MKYSNKILIYTSIFFVCSCTSGFPKGKKKKNEKKNWEAFVNTPATDSSIKEYWVELIDGKWDFFKSQGSSLTEQDLPTVKFIQSLYYIIDSTTFFNYKKSIPLGSILKLDKTHIVNYVVKNDSIQGVVDPAFVNGKWINDYGYGVPFKPIAKKIYEIVHSGGEVYNINIVAFPSLANSFRKYVVAYTGKRFMKIGYDGNLTPFEDELLIIKTYALKIAEEMK